MNDPGDLMRLAVPAGLYTVQNNLAYFAMSHLDAATYQLLYQLKILTTAIFSVLLLKKSLSPTQWTSLCLLCLGVGLVQSSSAQKLSAGLPPSSVVEKDGELPHKTMGWGNQALGLTAVVSACCSSGLAGVYFEMVLKNARTSLWIRNIQLAFFGILLGLVSMQL